MLFSLGSSNCTSRLGTSFVAGSHLLCKTLSSVMELLSPASSARAEAEAVSESWWSPDSWLRCSSRIINLAVFYLSLQRTSLKEPVSGRRLQEVSAHLIGNEVAFLAMRIGGTWPNDREAENTLQKKKKICFGCTGSQILLYSLPYFSYQFLSTSFPHPFPSCWLYPFLFFSVKPFSCLSSTCFHLLLSPSFSFSCFPPLSCPHSSLSFPFTPFLDYFKHLPA